jgi:flagellar basal body-associated protein FliL
MNKKHETEDLCWTIIMLICGLITLGAFPLIVWFFKTTIRKAVEEAK